MSEDVIRFEIAKLQLKPGDALVVKREMAMSPAQIEQIRLTFKRHVPEGVAVIVLAPGLTLEVLTR